MEKNIETDVAEDRKKTKTKTKLNQMTRILKHI